MWLQWISWYNIWCTWGCKVVAELFDLPRKLEWLQDLNIEDNTGDIPHRSRPIWKPTPAQAFGQRSGNCRSWQSIRFEIGRVCTLSQEQTSQFLDLRVRKLSIKGGTMLHQPSNLHWRTVLTSSMMKSPLKTMKVEILASCTVICWDCNFSTKHAVASNNAQAQCAMRLPIKNFCEWVLSHFGLFRYSYLCNPRLRPVEKRSATDR